MFGWPDLVIVGILGFLAGFLIRKRPPDPPPPKDPDYWWQRGEEPPGYGD